MIFYIYELISLLPDSRIRQETAYANPILGPATPACSLKSLAF